jgi:hypothetical protein
MRSVRNTARNLGTHLAVVGQKHRHQRLHQPSKCSGDHLVTAIYRLVLSFLMVKKTHRSKRQIHRGQSPVLTEFESRGVLFSLLEAVRLDPSSAMNWHNDI